MDMSLDFEALGALFELSRDAVLGVEAGTIRFANPAAQKMLKARAGTPAEAIVPLYILESEGSRFVATAFVGDKSADVAVTRLGDAMLLSYSMRAEDSPAPPEGAVRVFSEALANLRLALDGLVSASEAEKDPRTKSYSSVLYQSYFRLLRLCSHLSLADNLSRNQLPFAPRAVDLEELCAKLCESVQNLTKSLEIHLEFRCEYGLYLTAADPELLEILVLNLLTNSLQRCPKGGHVRVSLRRQGGRFILSVDDDGSGIGAEKLPHLYDRMSDGPLPDYLAGAGLGLALVRGIAEKHGGAVLLESRDSGCSARVLLPQRDAESPELRQPHPRYGNDGLYRILSELSVILPKELYKRNMMD